MITTITLNASAIHPGDVLIDTEGRRRFAAFDVDTLADGTVRVWTAISDQDRGSLPTVDLGHDDVVHVQRRSGPRVTHTTVEVPYDDRPFPHEAERALDEDFDAFLDRLND